MLLAFLPKKIWLVIGDNFTILDIEGHPNRYKTDSRQKSSSGRSNNAGHIKSVTLSFLVYDTTLLHLALSKFLKVIFYKFDMRIFGL